MQSNERIYVFSTGRVGSTYITKTINTLTKCDIMVHQQPYARLINIMGHMIITGKMPSALQTKIPESIYRKKLPRSTADPLTSSLISSYISRFDPKDYKIIHLIRDPRDFVTSFMNWKERKLSGKIAHHFTPFWQPSPLHTGEIGLRDWFKLPKFEQYCWIWNFKNKYFYDTFQNQENYILIRLEDLISEKYEETWGRVLIFLNFSAPNGIEKNLISNQVNKSRQVYFEKWINWNPDQAKLLNHHCGDLMHQLGYGEEEAWVSKLHGV